MAVEDDFTTLLCLFHHQNEAEAAYNDLLKAGVDRESISRIHSQSSVEAAVASLKDMGVPEQDEQHLVEGLRSGGSILVVEAIRDHVRTVEGIFGDHRATKIDEATIDSTAVLPLAAAASAAETTIPVVDEELVVGKRTVDHGGVRVYRRVIEVPVEESVQFREEHANIKRRPVDRAVTDRDLALQGERTIELKETAEEAVISKSAHVVEEVRVSKEATERTEHIRGTVRRTEVELEEVAPANGQVDRESVVKTVQS